MQKSGHGIQNIGTVAGWIIKDCQKRLKPGQHLESMIPKPPHRGLVGLNWAYRPLFGPKTCAVLMARGDIVFELGRKYGDF